MIQSNNLQMLIDVVIAGFYISALFCWGYLTIVLMEVTVCKDARSINTQKLLHKPLSLRFKIFKRSLRNIFYRASFGMFIGAILATLILIHQLWINSPKQIEWVIFHNIFPLSTIYLFHWLGHDVTFFVKLRLFLKGELN